MTYLRIKNLIIKILPTIIDAVIVFIAGMILAPFQYLPAKIFIILIFFLYNLFFLIFHKNRSLGMMAINSFWQADYKKSQQIIYLIFSTASFASIFYYVIYPFDLLIVNLLLLQIPTLWRKNNTFHAQISGLSSHTIQPLLEF